MNSQIKFTYKHVKCVSVSQNGSQSVKKTTGVRGRGDIDAERVITVVKKILRKESSWRVARDGDGLVEGRAVPGREESRIIFVPCEYGQRRRSHSR